jgi:hypothetical protein
MLRHFFGSKQSRIWLPGRSGQQRSTSLARPHRNTARVGTASAASSKYEEFELNAAASSRDVLAQYTVKRRPDAAHP